MALSTHFTEKERSPEKLNNYSWEMGGEQQSIANSQRAGGAADPALLRHPASVAPGSGQQQLGARQRLSLVSVEWRLLHK